MTNVEFKMTYSTDLDGKDVAVTGPTVPADATISATRSGPRSLKLETKVKGKPMFRETYTVSADGKTLTDVGSPVPVKEPATLVYDKQ